MKNKGTVSKDMLCVAEITTAHGIKGMVKLRIFLSDPSDIESYLPLYDSTGEREFNFTYISEHKNSYIAYLEGITDRNQAEELRGTRLYINRNDLPDLEEEDTYYYTDLIGLDVKDPDGKEIGVILNVVDFGAGELLEIRHAQTGKNFYLQFKDEFVHNVDIEKKTVTAIIPEGVI